MKKILLIEDESSIAAPLSALLEREGFAVERAETLEQGDRLFQSPRDLVILDWMLPDGQGIDLLKAWRAQGSKVPVIILTARDDLVDKVLGLELGADDYVTKPFEPKELIARIRARLRSHGVTQRERAFLCFAGVEIAPQTREVTHHGEKVSLTRMEFNLLSLFMENPGVVFTRDELLDRVWGIGSYSTTRTVDTHILQLRQKFRAALFETIRGVGYRITDKE